MVRHIVFRYGTAWFGQAGTVSFVELWQVPVRQITAGKLRRREFSFVEAGSGWLGALMYGKARFGRVWQVR